MQSLWPYRQLVAVRLQEEGEVRNCQWAKKIARGIMSVNVSDSHKQRCIKLTGGGGALPGGGGAG